MSYCLNPSCQNAENAANAQSCHCGTDLLLAGQYRAIQLLGQGGLGRTLLSEDQTNPARPRCVIKQFYPQGQIQGQQYAHQAAELFAQEALRLKQLGDHDQIPRFLDQFEQNGCQYLVQELIDGETLAQEFQETGFCEQKIRGILNDLLPVLRFIHQRQVIHRDVKPENIIRRRSDRKLVLVDFGAAKYATATALARTGTTIGSAGYAAPEQLRGKALFASDLYSLGVTCIHLLTRLDPFDLYDPLDNTFVWRPYVQDNPISDDLILILDKMTQAQVRQRYQSAEQVLADLNRPIAPRSASGTFNSAKPGQWDCVQTLSGHTSPVCSLAFSPNGQTLASGGAGKVIKLWQSDSGREIFTLDDGPLSRFGLVCAVAFSPDGQLLASCSFDKTIRLWQVNSGKKIRSLGGWFSGHTDYVYSIAFSPDGQRLASCSFDKTIRLWQVNSGKELSMFPDRFVHWVAFSPTGRLLALSSSDQTIQLWQLGDGGELCVPISHASPIRSTAFSSDGQLLAVASADQMIRLWQVSGGETVRPVGSWASGHCNAIHCLTFSPDAHLLASGSADQTLKLWQVGMGREVATLKDDAAISAAAFSPDGRRLASGSGDGAIKIWQLSEFDDFSAWENREAGCKSTDSKQLA